MLPLHRSNDLNTAKDINERKYTAAVTRIREGSYLYDKEPIFRRMREVRTGIRSGQEIRLHKVRAKKITIEPRTAFQNDVIHTKVD